MSMSPSSPLCTTTEITLNTVGTAAVSLSIGSVSAASAAYLLAIPAAAGGLFGLTALATNAVLDLAFGAQEPATIFARIAQVVVKYLISVAVAISVVGFFGFNLSFGAAMGLSLVSVLMIQCIAHCTKWCREGC